MDPNDQSPGLVDDSCPDGNSRSIQKSETGNGNIHLLSSTDKKSNENNDSRLEKRSENGHSVDVTKVKKRKIQNESPEMEDGGLPVGPFDKGSERLDDRLDSRLDGSECLKTSASMLSFTSTAATCGSSSDGMSIDEELLDDPEEIGEKCEQDFSKSRLGLLFEGVEITSDSSTTSCFDTDRVDQSRETDCVSTGAAESSLQEDSETLKSPEKSISNETIDTPSSPQERRSNNFKSDGITIERLISAAEYVSSRGEKLFSKNTATVPPLLEKANSSTTTEDEKLDFGATGGFDDFDSNRQKEDKSVRRKVKIERPTTTFAESVSDNTRKIGHSLLGIAKSMESTSTRGSLHKYYGRNREVKFASSKAWLNDILSVYHPTKNADTTSRLDTESLLKEVKNFFQNHEVDGDENLSWRENKYLIITTRYFSDEFSRSHGLLTFEELHQKWVQDIKRDSARFLSNQLKMLELCRRLNSWSISEQRFTEYVENPHRDIETNAECTSELYEKTAFRRLDDARLYCIEEDFGFGVMQELYEKLARGGSSFNSILNESQVHDATEISPRSREQPSTSENSSQFRYESLAGNQDTFYMPLNRTIARDMSKHIGCTSSIEGGCVPKDEAESSQGYLRELKKTSNVNLGFDSNVSHSSIRLENKPHIEMTLLSPNKSAEKFESGNEQSTDKEVSKASAEDLK